MRPPTAAMALMVVALNSPAEDQVTRVPTSRTVAPLTKFVPLTTKATANEPWGSWDGITPVTVGTGTTGTTALDGYEAPPVPSPLVAVTVRVQVSPMVRSVTVSGLVEPLDVCPPLAGVVRSTAVTV